MSKFGFSDLTSPAFIHCFMPTNSSEQKLYVFQPKQNRWLISYSQDSGLDLALKQNHAEILENKDKTYWTIAPELFDNVKNILIQAGYSEFQPGHTTVEYKLKPETTAPVKPETTAPETKDNAYSVKEITELVKDTIDKRFNLPIWISGEILDQKRNQYSAYYFDLAEKYTDETGKENQYKISAIIWSKDAKNIDAQIRDGKLLPLNNGTKIRAKGKISFYPKTSSLSFVITEIDAHFAEGEILKKKKLIGQNLKEMGLYDLNKNIPMPYLPLRIALISSKTAAGKDDIQSQLNKFKFPFRVTLFPALMQGENLENSVLSSFHDLEKIGFDQFDIAILARGGGSFLDLAWFNSQPIAEFIARCPLKFLIGIGHNRDSCVLDDIATSFATPTAIADHLNTTLQTIEDALKQAAQNIVTNSHNRLQLEQQKLQTKATQCAQYLSERRRTASQELSWLETSLRQATQNLRHDETTRLQTYASDIKFNVMQIQTEKSNQLSNLIQKMQSAKDNRILKENAILEHEAASIVQKTEIARQHQLFELNRLRDTINLLNPMALLERGFTTISDGSGKRITSVQGITQNDQLTIRLIDGKLAVCVETVQPIPSSNVPNDENKG